MMNVVEHDACTQTTISRQANAEEQQAAAIALAEMQQQAEAFDKQIKNKNAAIVKLQSLGLTEDEINALVG